MPPARSDLNLLVANYLFTEGYLSAAENFSREAGLDTARLGTAGGATYDLESIRNRMDIRRAVLKGEVETALEKVVDLDLEVSPTFVCDLGLRSMPGRGVLQR